jgi:hypothetical protein
MWEFCVSHACLQYPSFRRLRRSLEDLHHLWVLAECEPDRVEVLCVAFLFSVPYMNEKILVIIWACK